MIARERVIARFLMYSDALDFFTRKVKSYKNKVGIDFDIRQGRKEKPWEKLR